MRPKNFKWINTFWRTLRQSIFYLHSDWATELINYPVCQTRLTHVTLCDTTWIPRSANKKPCLPQQPQIRSETNIHRLLIIFLYQCPLAYFYITECRLTRALAVLRRNSAQSQSERRDLRVDISQLFQPHHPLRDQHNTHVWAIKSVL